MSSSRFHFTKQ